MLAQGFERQVGAVCRHSRHFENPDSVFYGQFLERRTECVAETVHTIRLSLDAVCFTVGLARMAEILLLKTPWAGIGG